MDFDLIFNSIFTVIVALNLFVMLKWDLMMLQQNSYRNERYKAWIKQSQETSSLKRIVISVVAVSYMSLLAFKSFYVVAILAFVLLVQALKLLGKKYKKPLVFTNRVKRLFYVELAILAIVALLLLCFCGLRYANIWLVLSLFWSHYYTLGVNWLMKPVEKHISDGFVHDAERRLAEMPNMVVVGITGSYGKTSTKHYLNRILSEKYSVLMTPGSFNTPMGVVRTVREMMEPYNEVFICEMGAKNIGDIKEICDIVHPTYGIITAVGPQHLESFKTIENVQSTKFELADALNANGMVVVNNDFEYIANRPVDNVPVKRYTVEKTDRSDFWAEDVTYSSAGTTFTVVGKDGHRITLQTKLVGECNISNLIAAVIIALKLEVPAAKIQYAVSKIEQVEHRLNMKRTAAGITIIDDAYNSNPSGSRMALDVLSHMTEGKRIVITPGMIELGEKQAYYNGLFGEHIAETCDVAIVVGQYNRDAIVGGIKKKGFPEENLHVVDSFAEAQQLMLGLAQRGDTVLYENDLPDTFK